jgi:hypothetical protein
MQLNEYIFSNYKLKYKIKMEKLVYTNPKGIMVTLNKEYQSLLTKIETVGGNDNK